MKHLEKLMHTKDTYSYGVYTAIAQYWLSQRIEIDIYLYRTLICVIDLYNHSFELANYKWISNRTLKALKEWKEYLQSQGYKLTECQWTGVSPERFNLDVRLPSLSHIGGYDMECNKLLCHHIGKSDKALKSINDDEFYISSNMKLPTYTQPHTCYMRGRNEQQIADFVRAHDGVKFTLHFDLPEPPEICGLWERNETLYLFHFRPQAVYYRADFKACNVTYTADEMYRTSDDATITLIKMCEIKDSAYIVYQEMLDNFKRLV